MEDRLKDLLQQHSSNPSTKLKVPLSFEQLMGDKRLDPKFRKVPVSKPSLVLRYKKEMSIAASVLMLGAVWYLNMEKPTPITPAQEIAGTKKSNSKPELNVASSEPSNINLEKKLPKDASIIKSYSESTQQPKKQSQKQSALKPIELADNTTLIAAEKEKIITITPEIATQSTFEDLSSVTNEKINAAHSLVEKNSEQNIPEAAPELMNREVVANNAAKVDKSEYNSSGSTPKSFIVKFLGRKIKKWTNDRIKIEEGEEGESVALHVKTNHLDIKKNINYNFITE